MLTILALGLLAFVTYWTLDAIAYHRACKLVDKLRSTHQR